MNLINIIHLIGLLSTMNSWNVIHRCQQQQRIWSMMLGSHASATGGRCCGGIGLMVTSNIVRAVSVGASTAVGFLPTTTTRTTTRFMSSTTTSNYGLLQQQGLNWIHVSGQNRRQPKYGMNNILQQQQQQQRLLQQQPKRCLATAATTQGGDGEDFVGDNGAEEAKQPRKVREKKQKTAKNPFVNLSLDKTTKVSAKDDEYDDYDTSSGIATSASTPRKNRLLLKQNKNINSKGPSWMERNEAFVKQSREEDDEDSMPSPKRRSPPRSDERRSDAMSSPNRRSTFRSDDRRSSSSDDRGGERRRTEFGDRRRSSSSSSSYRSGRNDRFDESGGRGRRRLESSSPSNFRRWDNINDDKPREWSTEDSGGNRRRRGGRNYDDDNDDEEESRGDRGRRGGGDERPARSYRQDFRGTRVFVQGLSQDTTWQQLKDHFRVAGEVVFASVSVDQRTGESKGHGIVQFETTDMARNAIAIMREHPLDGEKLFVRADVQEKQSDATVTSSPRRRSTGGDDDSDYYSNRRSSSSSFKSPSTRGTTRQSTTWRCADEESVELIPEEDQIAILKLIKSRDAARRERDYDTSDDLREQLRSDFGVHLDDRLKMWWVSYDGTNVPTSIRQIKGDDGRWGKPKPWRQIPTSIENDVWVNADVVNELLEKRDAARQKRDFETADQLLEQARTAPEGGLELRIHDESRTWRIWTPEPPPRTLNKSPAEQCLDLVREYAPHKEEDILLVLEKFQGREFKILKKLKQRYLKGSPSVNPEDVDNYANLIKDQPQVEQELQQMEEEEQEEDDDEEEEIVVEEQEEEGDKEDRVSGEQDGLGDEESVYAHGKHDEDLKT